MSVAELGERVSSLEMTYWQAFFKLEKEDLDRATKTPTARDDEAEMND
jgi:hypothetical protein